MRKVHVPMLVLSFILLCFFTWVMFSIAQGGIARGSMNYEQAQGMVQFAFIHILGALILMIGSCFIGESKITH